MYAIVGDPHDPAVRRLINRREWRTVEVAVHLQRVVDLTDVQIQARLQTTAQELTGDWTGYAFRESDDPVSQPTGLAPTQDLGQALFDTGDVEGFMAISAKVPEQRVLVVFPTRLLPGSSIDAHLSRYERKLVARGLMR